MSTNSNDQGRAYEYAWIQALYETLSRERKTRIVENSSLIANERAWRIIDPRMQDIFVISADSAVNTLIELEPRMMETNCFWNFKRMTQEPKVMSGTLS